MNVCALWPYLDLTSVYTLHKYLIKPWWKSSQYEKLDENYEKDQKEKYSGMRSCLERRYHHQ